MRRKLLSCPSFGKSLTTLPVLISRVHQGLDAEWLEFQVGLLVAEMPTISESPVMPVLTSSEHWPETSLRCTATTNTHRLQPWSQFICGSKTQSVRRTPAMSRRRAKSGSDLRRPEEAPPMFVIWTV